MSCWLSLVILNFNRIVLNEGSHQCVVSLFAESLWDFSSVPIIVSSVFPSLEDIDIAGLEVNILFVIGGRLIVGLNGIFLSRLDLGPVVVEMAGKG